MTYQWDRNKARSNLQKHGVNFADTVGVFEDDLALTLPDDDPAVERYATIGRDFVGRILAVVYTWRDDNIRIISARKATGKERAQYEDR